MRTYLKNATLIDGTGAPAHPGCGLVIEGDTLAYVGRLDAADAPSPDTTRVIDVGGQTVLPGLVEAHIHLSYNHVKVIADLDIVDTTDAHHPRIAIPYTFVLDAERMIHKIYNGWWYVGRPTVEELRMDLRALMARRRDWWYDDTPAPYAQGAQPRA